VLVYTASLFSGDSRKAAISRFGLGIAPVIVAVAPLSAADKAGIRPGDVLLSVNGVAMADRPGRRGGDRDVALVHDALDAAFAKGEARLTLRRGDRERTTGLNGDRACASRLEVIPSRRLNAVSDGQYVQLTSAVVGEAQDDDELAFIIAHEAAHNQLGHPQRIRRDRLRGSAIRTTEIEADQLALRLMDAAGFDVHAAARFWGRFGPKTSPGLFGTGTHLPTDERIALLRAEADRVLDEGLRQSAQ
jgi:Zn-dependent protease with chaperone function